MALVLEGQTVTPFSALELATGTPLYGGHTVSQRTYRIQVEDALRRTAKALGLRLSNYQPAPEDVLREENLIFREKTRITTCEFCSFPLLGC